MTEATLETEATLPSSLYRILVADNGGFIRVLYPDLPHLTRWEASKIGATSTKRNIKCTSMCMGPDEETMFVGRENGTICIYRVPFPYHNDEQKLQLPYPELIHEEEAHDDTILSISFDSTTSTVLTTSMDTTVNAFTYTKEEPYLSKTHSATFRRPQGIHKSVAVNVASTTAVGGCRQPPRIYNPKHTDTPPIETAAAEGQEEGKQKHRRPKHGGIPNCVWRGKVPPPNFPSGLHPRFVITALGAGGEHLLAGDLDGWVHCYRPGCWSADPSEEDREALWRRKLFDTAVKRVALLEVAGKRASSGEPRPRWVGLACDGMGQARLLSLSTGKDLRSFRRITGSVTAVASCGPDEERIVIGSADRFLRLFTVKSRTSSKQAYLTHEPVCVCVAVVPVVEGPVMEEGSDVASMDIDLGF
eukprot:gnl/Dysnectes_brevis/1834_a2104_1408.p1 GENE.gnl/Dysnectes_brevis/1834_a2104_1408~~gnl/Dysnectes_brevis/1834_a2104_1408.p1  ORF type:complete len:417 (+),score=108.42 gnl/Dysnectes_brevis/1834_a2104_1408:33-1283(+)